jgi:hypothetical protein
LYLPVGYDKVKKKRKMPLLILSSRIQGQNSAGQVTQNQMSLLSSYGSFVYWVTKVMSFLMMLPVLARHNGTK